MNNPMGTNITKGLDNIAYVNSPPNKQWQACVSPQSGHGKPKIALKGQKKNSVPHVVYDNISQASPVTHTIDTDM